MDQNSNSRFYDCTELFDQALDTLSLAKKLTLKYNGEFLLKWQVLLGKKKYLDKNNISELT